MVMSPSLMVGLVLSLPIISSLDFLGQIGFCICVGDTLPPDVLYYLWDMFNQPWGIMHIASLWCDFRWSAALTYSLGSYRTLMDG